MGTAAKEAVKMTTPVLASVLGINAQKLQFHARVTWTAVPELAILTPVSRLLLEVLAASMMIATWELAMMAHVSVKGQA